jgi:hypothetical protein
MKRSRKKTDRQRLIFPIFRIIAARALDSGAPFLFFFFSFSLAAEAVTLGVN